MTSSASPGAPGGPAGLVLPPADLHSRELLTRRIEAGALGYRTHAPGHSPIWFGPKGQVPVYRFDDPIGAYKVCYIGSRRIAAFAETFLRDLPTRTVSQEQLEKREISAVRFTRAVEVVHAHGRGLARLGTTSAIAGAKLIGASQPYEHSQAWSRALFEHPSAFDGIEYKSSHDDDLLCLALFDRARAALEELGNARNVWRSKGLVLHAIERYRLELL